VIVVVCGDRNWTREIPILRRLAAFHKGTTIVTGGAPGADSIAHKIAEDLELKTTVIYAHWRHHPLCPSDCTEITGKAAGPIRNRKMLNYNPQLVVGFHQNIRESKGTLDCLLEALERGIPVELWKR
jgi:hypothetical protein